MNVDPSMIASQLRDGFHLPEALSRETGSAGRLPFSATLTEVMASGDTREAAERIATNHQGQAIAAAGCDKGPEDSDPLREAFQDFVGQTFFGQLIKSLRSTEDGAKYLDGGQTERIFRSQLDQTLAAELSKNSAAQIADPMFELFQLGRPS
ncbi:MAG: hypothetical protein KatS3mg111_2285 [Pirellulaceae bacterium]|nr:MAG: hypothetical protein KatS3mg111_2285 [Pirellulaceae bacterium]